MDPGSEDCLVEFTMDDSWELLADSMMVVVEQSEEPPNNKEAGSDSQPRMTSDSSVTSHAPSVEGQVAMVADKEEVKTRSSLEDADEESKDDWEIWGSLEDHLWFMEKTLEYIPEPGDSLRNDPPPVPDPSTHVNLSVETPGGVLDQDIGRPLLEGMICSPRGLPVLATAGDEGVSSTNGTEDEATFVSLSDVEQPDDVGPSGGHGVVAEDPIPPANDRQSSSKAPVMKDVELEERPDNLTVMPSTSQAGTSAGKHTGKENTVSSIDQNVRKDCVHDAEGVCDIHGAGAKEHWRYAKGMVKGRRGSTPTMKHTKEWYWACDLGTRGGGKMRQLSLSSYMKTTSNKKTSTQNTSVPQPDRDNAVLRGDLSGSMTVKKHQ